VSGTVTGAETVAGVVVAAGVDVVATATVVETAAWLELLEQLAASMARASAVRGRAVRDRIR
jgi:hypothetical protein